MPEPPSASIPAAPLYEWRIIRLRGTPGIFVGYVNAPDQEQAIQKAAENFGVMEEDLGAYKVRESPTMSLRDKAQRRGSDVKE